MTFSSHELLELVMPLDPSVGDTLRQAMKFRGRIAFVAAAIVALVAGTATPAEAASTYLYRTNGGSIFMTQRVGSSSGILIRNGTKAKMLCWTTGPNTNSFGNYWTAKYFKIDAYTTAGTKRGYVTASVVANQTIVGRC